MLHPQAWPNCLRHPRSCPPPVFEELPEPEVFEELPRPEPSLSLEVSASQMGDYPDFDSQVEEVE